MPPANDEQKAPERRKTAAGVPQRLDRIVRIPGTGQEIELGGFALALMLAAILLPAVFYSIRLNDPKPADLLVAMCIGLFGSLVYLWVLDATDTIRFRSPWVSRGIYGLAIVSVLGTSVGVYKDAFQQDPYQREWLITVHDGAGKVFVNRRSVVLLYSKSNDLYWGYGARPTSSTSNDDSRWIEVTSFQPTLKKITISLGETPGSAEVIVADLRQDGGRLSSTDNSSSTYRLDLVRRN